MSVKFKDFADNTSKVNRFGIPTSQILHDLTLFKMEQVKDTTLPPVTSPDYDVALFSCYHEIFSDMCIALNSYCKTHEY